MTYEFSTHSTFSVLYSTQCWGKHSSSSYCFFLHGRVLVMSIASTDECIRRLILEKCHAGDTDYEET